MVVKEGPLTEAAKQKLVANLTKQKDALETKANRSDKTDRRRGIRGLRSQEVLRLHPKLGPPVVPFYPFLGGGFLY